MITSIPTKIRVMTIACALVASASLQASVNTDLVSSCIRKLVDVEQNLSLVFIKGDNTGLKNLQNLTTIDNCPAEQNAAGKVINKIMKTTNNFIVKAGTIFCANAGAADLLANLKSKLDIQQLHKEITADLNTLLSIATKEKETDLVDITNALIKFVTHINTKWEQLIKSNRTGLMNNLRKALK